MFDQSLPLPDWTEPFLAELCRHGLIHTAARAVGTTPRQVSKYREGNETFEEYVQQALEESNDILELEARRRAVDGIEKGVYYQGVQVATETVYSDSLLVKMLEAKRKQEFSSRIQVEAYTPPTILIRDFTLTEDNEVIDAEFTPVKLSDTTSPSHYLASPASASASPSPSPSASASASPSASPSASLDIDPHDLA